VSFSKFAMLYADESDHFIDVNDADRDEARPIEGDQPDRFLHGLWAFAMV
jgi:hypothetical protein